LSPRPWLRDHPKQLLGSERGQARVDGDQPGEKGRGNRGGEAGSETVLPFAAQPKQIGILAFGDKFDQTTGSIKKPIDLIEVHLVDRHYGGKISGPFALGKIRVAAGADDMDLFEVGFVVPVFEFHNELFFASATKAAIEDLVAPIKRFKGSSLDDVTLRGEIE
jgi:hypothetical protein